MLEHVPEKWSHFSDKDMLQHIELARILIDQVIPPDRNRRWSMSPKSGSLFGEECSKYLSSRLFRLVQGKFT